MELPIPIGYWAAFSDFARRLGNNSPEIGESIGATKLSEKDISALRNALSTYGENVGTVNRMKCLVEELLALAMQNLSNEQVTCAVKCLNQLIELCDFHGVAFDFCKMGAARLLVPFVRHCKEEIKTPALDAVCLLVQDKRTCQNEFALAHFVPILMHIVSDESNDLCQRRAMHALFCLCFGNELISKLFCQSGGIIKLLHFTRYKKLATESCLTLAKILDTVPQYKRNACKQRTIEVLVDLAYETSDPILQEKAVEALFVVVNGCVEAKKRAQRKQCVLRPKLNALLERFAEQQSTKDLAGACMVIIKRLYVDEADDLKWEARGWKPE